MIKAPKKLIECALPLDEINAAAAREKSIRHGHPSTLHLWWDRRPLAAARAVLFAQLVNDPGGERGWGKYTGQTKKDAQSERERLFDILRELVKWENTNNEELLEKAREEIRKSWRETCEINKGKPGFDPEKLPAFHDPFAGGGAIPLEAQRLGLEAYASDLNPVAVLINKAMIEIPPKFAGKPPVGPVPDYDQGNMRGENDWTGAKGLAEDVRRYGHWMRKQAEKRIGHLYPKVKITKEMVDERPDLAPYLNCELTVIAWIWARTVKSPNPAFSHVDVPLASTFMLSTKKGKEAYVQPVIEGDGYRFEVKVGKPEDAEEVKKGTKLGRGAKFKCLMSDSPMSSEYVRGQFKAKKNKDRLMAIVAEGEGGRIYISPTQDQEQLARTARPNWMPDQKMNQDTSNLVSGRGYGITHWHEIFSPRQLVALTTFSDLVQETREKIISDAQKTGWPDDSVGLDDGGLAATAYGDGIATYLTLAVGRSANYWSSFTPWSGEFIVQTFGRQAIPMIWDYAEVNLFSNSTGNWFGALDWIKKVIVYALPAIQGGFSVQQDAQTQTLSNKKIISTDPPYYNNIGYADLSDFFYIWLRRSLKSIFPANFATLATPKSEELVATPYRHGNQKKAEMFFLEGMTQALSRLSNTMHPGFPITVYYAFKQSETQVELGTVSTGWETFLNAILFSGFVINGTWPMRTERDQGLKTGTNVLASCIILVCRKRYTPSYAGNQAILTDGDGDEITIPVTDVATTIEFSNGFIKVKMKNGEPSFTDAGGETESFDNLTAKDLITEGPSLVSTTPADEAPDVAVDANLTMTFDEDVSAGTGNIEIIYLADDTVAETIDITGDQVSFDGTTVTIDPDTDLNGNTEYYINVDSGAIQDVDGKRQELGDRSGPICPVIDGE